MSVFINACRLLPALQSLSQFGRGRLSLVAILFYALLLLFGSCRLSELTLVGPLELLMISFAGSDATSTRQGGIKERADGERGGGGQLLNLFV